MDGNNTALRGEVQQYDGQQWRTVLTAAGIPVVDHRRRPAGGDLFDQFIAREMRAADPGASNGRSGG